MRRRGASVRAAAEPLLWLGVASGLLWSIVGVSTLRAAPAVDGRDVPAGLTGWAAALAVLLLVSSGAALVLAARGRARVPAVLAGLGLVGHGVLAFRLDDVDALQPLYLAVGLGAGAALIGLALVPWPPHTPAGPSHDEPHGGPGVLGRVVAVLLVVGAAWLVGQVVDNQLNPWVGVHEEEETPWSYGVPAPLLTAVALAAGVPRAWRRRWLAVAGCVGGGIALAVVGIAVSIAVSY